MGMTMHSEWRWSIADMLRQPEAILRAWLWMDWRRDQWVSLMTGDQMGLAYSRTDLTIDL